MKQLQLLAKDIGRGNLILVNKKHPLQFEADQQQLKLCHPEFPEVLLIQEAAKMLQRLFVHLDSLQEIVPVSGFRPQVEQEALYRSSLRQYGKEFTSKFVALPGCSEHQTGLAIDLARQQATIDFICPEFPAEGICQSFRQIASQFGFIERYPAGRENITGIDAEPWHFRYVGAPHAEIMQQLGLTLEEYTLFLQGFPQEGIHFYPQVRNQQYEVFFVNVRAGFPVILTVPARMHHQISGNNECGFIVTLWEGNDETA